MPMNTTKYIFHCHHAVLRPLPSAKYGALGTEALRRVSDLKHSDKTKAHDISTVCRVATVSKEEAHAVVCICRIS